MGGYENLSEVLIRYKFTRSRLRFGASKFFWYRIFASAGSELGMFGAGSDSDSGEEWRK